MTEDKCPNCGATLVDRELLELFDDDDFFEAPSCDFEPPSKRPSLEGLGPVEIVEAMVGWFMTNYEILPVDDPAYIFIGGGPFDPYQELSKAFPKADELAIDAADQAIERQNAFHWTTSIRRKRGQEDVT